MKEINKKYFEYYCEELSLKNLFHIRQDDAYFEIKNIYVKKIDIKAFHYFYFYLNYNYKLIFKFNIDEFNPEKDILYLIN